MKPLVFLLALPLAAQTRIVFSPSEHKGLDATVWSIVACSPPGSSGAVIRAGVLFQHLAMHGARPLLSAEERDAFRRRQKESPASRFVKWAGYAAVAAGYLMTTRVVDASPEIHIAVSAAGGFLSVLVPLAQRNIPAPLHIESELIPAALQVPPGGCAQGVKLGGPGQHFEVIE